MLDGMSLFVVFALSLIGLFWAYTWYSIVLLAQWPSVIFYLLTAIWILTFLIHIWRWIQFERAHDWPRLLILSYVFLGFVSHSLGLALIKDSIFFILNFTDFNPSTELFPLVSQLCFPLSIFLNLYGSYSALRGPQIISTKIISDKLNKKQNLKIVQISDLHVGPIVTKKYVEKVVDQCLQLNPDIVCITGDLGDGVVSKLHDDLAPLEQLFQKIPTYYVSGNHEVYWNLSDWNQKLSKLGANVLINQGMFIDESKKIWIGGVPDIMTRGNQLQNESDIVAPDIESAFCKTQDPNLFQILLIHRPQQYKLAQKTGFDLMLCGHTHAGQFFPFNFLVGFFNPLVKGLYYRHGLFIYVNQGTGFWGPPLRLGTRCEISLIDIQAKV